MLSKRNEKVYFSWPEDEVESDDEEAFLSLRDDIECIFTSPLATQRSFRVVGAGHPTWTTLISPKARVKKFESFGGIPSLVIDQEGDVDWWSGLQFWWFKEEIYVLLSTDTDITLMKLTTENPKQDWQWLDETLVEKYGIEDIR